MKKDQRLIIDLLFPGRDLNPHSRFGEQDFKSCVSTSSTTRESVNGEKKTHPVFA